MCLELKVPKPGLTLNPKPETLNSLSHSNLNVHEFVGKGKKFVGKVNKLVGKVKKFVGKVLVGKVKM